MKPIPSLRQRGLTLVELMVAMVLMLLVSLATVGLFNISASSFKTVDAGQELQDNARFAMEIIGQAARSAGYQDRAGPVTVGDMTDNVFGPNFIDANSWRVQGANNAQLTGGSSLSFGSNDGINKSDALVMRFFGSNLPDPSNPAVAKTSGGLPVPDGSMIDCSGRAIPYPSASTDVGVSAFFVSNDASGEPQLSCLSHVPGTNTFVVTSVIRGVEAFQVMYGLDTEREAGQPSLEAACISGQPCHDGIPDKWISAGNWNTVGANPNWNEVVAIRVGMVLRGPIGSSQGQSSTASDNVYYPLGKAFTCGGSCPTVTEADLKFTPVNAADGRLRRAFAATFMIRNAVH